MNHHELMGKLTRLWYYHIFEFGSYHIFEFDTYHISEFGTYHIFEFGTYHIFEFDTYHIFEFGTYHIFELGTYHIFEFDTYHIFEFDTYHISEFGTYHIFEFGTYHIFEFCTYHIFEFGTYHILCPQRNFGRHIVITLSVRPSVSPSRFRVRSISPIFFEDGIPNLVCGCILGWRSVAYHFQVTVTLTLNSDLVFRIIVSGAYLLYHLR